VGSLAPLARRVARARPDAVFPRRAARHARHGRRARAARAPRPEVLLLAPSGFTPTSTLAKAAGAAAEGMYVSVAGVIAESLGPAGRRF
jgi:hypothetical protein